MYDYDFAKMVEENKSFEDFVIYFAQDFVNIDSVCEDYSYTINKIKEEIKKFQKMTIKQKISFFENKKNEDIAFAKKEIEKNKTAEKYLTDILNKIKKWKLDKKYRGLKDDMVKKIEYELAKCKSTFYDEYLVNSEKELKKGYKKWFEEIIKNDKKELKYFEKKQKEEAKRVQKERKELEELIKNLKGEK